MSVTEAAKSVVESVSARLPASYLSLVILNAIMMGLLLWVLHDVNVVRTAAIERVLVACTSALKQSSPADSSR